jgi:hypothetical protein
MKKDLQVEPSKEKRLYPRYEHSSPMFLYRMDYQDQYYYAEMKDYSKGGLSLLSNENLVVGQLVYLEMKNYDEYAAGPEKKKNYSGSVKWLSPYLSSNSDTKASYKYGIEYHEH